MFERAKTFVKNHWKKVVYTGVAVQVAAHGARYISSQLLQYQEREAMAYWDRVKKLQYFDQLENNCVQTFLQMMDQVKITLSQTLPCESVQTQLKNPSLSKEKKLLLWDELKVLAVTRVISTVQASSILYILTRVQLSMIGGCLISKARVDASQGHEHQAAQKQFLELSHYFASEGVRSMALRMKELVAGRLKDVTLKQQFSPAELHDLFGSFTEPEWKFVFPPELLRAIEAESLSLTDPYEKLCLELFDLFESEESGKLLGQLDRLGRSHFTDRVAEVIPQGSQGDEFVLAEAKAPLAKLIPVMCSLHLVEVEDDPWLSLVIGVESVKVFGANVYEAFASQS